MNTLLHVMLMRKLIDLCNEHAKWKTHLSQCDTCRIAYASKMLGDTDVQVSMNCCSNGRVLYQDYMTKMLASINDSQPTTEGWTTEVE